MKNKLLVILFVFVGLSKMLMYAGTNPKLEFYLRELQEYDLGDMKSLPLCDSIISISLGQKDTLEACRHYYRKGQCLSEHYEFSRALQAYSSILKLIPKKPRLGELDLLKQDAMVQTIRMARFVGMFSYSVEKCYELLSLQPEDNYRLFANSVLAINLWELDNYIAARESLAVADKIATEEQKLSPFYLSLYWNYKSGILYYQGKADSSVYCLNQALFYAEKEPRSGVLQNNYNNNLANVYMNIGEYDLAKRCFQKNFKAFRESSQSTSRLYVQQLYGYASLCYLVNERDSSAIYCKEVMRLADSLKVDEMGCLSRMLYSQLLYDKGRYKEAYNLYVRSADKMDSIQNINHSEKLAILHNSYNNQELERQHRLLQQEVRIYELQRKNRNYFILSLCLVIFVLLFIAVRMMRKYKINKQMRSELQQKMEIKESDMSSLRQSYDSTIDIKDEQLHILGKAMTAFNNVFSKVQDNLVEIESLSDLSTVKERVKVTLSIINRHRQEEIIVSFEEFFKQQFCSFSERLLSDYPTLTSSELRLCMFLALDMSAKEIAFYLNKSVRTVESMIYRFRKKVEIPVQVKTYDFVRGYLHDRTNQSDSTTLRAETPDS